MKKAHFKLLFLRKWETEGPFKTLSSLTLAIAKTSGNSLIRAGKRAFDFRQPSLPGLSPGPNQNPPALPPAKGQIPTLSGTEDALSRSTDWRKSRLWMWFSGGGWKGFLGARRYWASLTRHVLDGFGRVAWTFHVVAVLPVQFVLSRLVVLQKTLKTLKFDPAAFHGALLDYRRAKTAAEKNLSLARVHLHWCVSPPSKVYWRIWRAYCLIPLLAGAAVGLEALALAPSGGWERVVMALYSLLAIGFGLWPSFVLMRINDRLPEVPSDLRKIPGSSPILAGFAIPAFVHSAPGSIPSCVFSTFFGNVGGSSGSCSGSPLGSFIQGSQVLANIAPALAIVAGMVSILALFLLTVTYGYYLTQAMHTAAHTGDWTHQGVNAAWAPIRGAVSVAMIAAPGGLSILASFVLFVASTGNGIGDAAASKVSATLVAPSIATTIPPGLQGEVDNALFSLVCAHVLDNFVDPHGTTAAVTAQPDNFGGLEFSNVVGVGSYGPSVCGNYSMPPGSSTTMASNQAFLAMVRPGGPLDQVATAIASGVNGCGSLVIGTGLSPCAPAGTPSNRSVFGHGGGLTNPAGGNVGTLSQVTQQYVTSLVIQGQSTGGTPVSEVQTQGWVALGAFYEFMSNTSTNWNQIVQSLPENIAPGGFADWSTLSPDVTEELQNAFRETQTYVDHWGFSGNAAGPSLPFWAAAPLSSSGTGRNMSSSLSAVVDPTTQQTLSLPNYMAQNLNADPLSKLQNVIESADTAAVVGQVAVGNPYGRAVITAGAAAVGGPTGATLAYAGAKKAKEILDPVTVVLGILTIVVGSYLPLVAMFAAGFYALFWILEVTILVLFAPLWALAVGIPQGEGFIGQHGKEGLSRVTDIALRPVLFAGMFVVSLGLYYLSADMLIVLTSEALGANKSNPTAGMFFSIEGVLGSYLVYALVLWRTIHFSFEVLHTGPYWAMKVLGIESRDGRESRAMEAGGQNVLHSMQTVFSGIGRPMPPSGGGKGGQA